MVICPHCGKEHDRGTMSKLCWDCDKYRRRCKCCNHVFYSPHGELWCTTCLATCIKECNYCGREEVINNKFNFCIQCIDEQTVRCSSCSERVLKTNSVLFKGLVPFCTHCYEIYIQPCTVCGESQHIHNMQDIDGVWVCPSCYVTCCNCEEYCVADSAIPWENDNPLGDDYLCPHCTQFIKVCNCCGSEYLKWSGSRDLQVCRSCFSEHYAMCIECGVQTLRSTMEGDYCNGCYGDGSIVFGRIQNHYFRPRFEMHRFPDESGSLLYMGVELEVDEGGHSNINAKRIYQVAEKHCYIKHDGSLDDGFEIVSHPATLAYHSEKLPWKEICNKALELGYRSHDTETCGLHVHVNRNYFGDIREVVMGIVLIVEKFWNQMLRFSRRDNMCKVDNYARRYNIQEQELTPANMYEFYEGAMSSGRYHAVNLENQYTVEFRIFRGTLKASTIIATLQMVSHIVNTAKDFSIQDIFEMDWFFFMGLIPAQYTELLKYIERRKLTEGQWNGVGIDFDLDRFECDLTRDVG